MALYNAHNPNRGGLPTGWGGPQRIPAMDPTAISPLATGPGPRRLTNVPSRRGGVDAPRLGSMRRGRGPYRGRQR